MLMFKNDPDYIQNTVKAHMQTRQLRIQHTQTLRKACISLKMMFQKHLSPS